MNEGWWRRMSKGERWYCIGMMIIILFALAILVRVAVGTMDSSWLCAHQWKAC